MSDANTCSQCGHKEISQYKLEKENERLAEALRAADLWNEPDAIRDRLSYELGEALQAIDSSARNNAALRAERDSWKEDHGRMSRLFVKTMTERDRLAASLRELVAVLEEESPEFGDLATARAALAALEEK